MTGRCTVCGQVIRVIAFLDDDYCSIDCRKADNPAQRKPAWVAITEDTDG